MTEEEFSFFGFRMIDNNQNEISLSQFQEKDVIVVVNCKLIEETEQRAPLYTKIEDKFEKRVQILCIPAGRFFYEGLQDDESLRLISFLKAKANCRIPINDEDGLVFVIDNNAHNVGKEVISCVGRNLTPNQVSDEIIKHLN